MNTHLHLWSRGQREAFHKLKQMAELFFYTEWPVLYRVEPRLNPLVVGPSGIGKSHLVRALAEDLEMPVLRVTPSSWMLCGAKDQVSTLSRIHAFVTAEDVGILHIDEGDKFYANSTGDWPRYVRGEAFDLLDRTIVATHPSVPWNDYSIEKFRRNFMLIGTGTWQTLWDQPAKQALGFGSAQGQQERDVSREIRESMQIPTELLRRFNSNIIIIPPATQEDYRDAAAEFGLIKLAVKLKIKLNFAEAAQQALGGRWFEEQFTKLLLIAREKNRTDLFSLRNPFPVEEGPDIDEDQGESYQPVL